MPEQLEPHYSDFVGLDTRSNKLKQHPKSFRRGSRNFRYNFQDEIQKGNGFQHKDDNSGAAKMGLIEYKYRDINTGASKTQILGVDATGSLNKKIADYLKLAVSGGSVYSYSFFYEEVGNNWKIQFEDSAGVSLGSTTASTSTTLNALVTAINALAIAGLTASVVDEDGTASSSTKTAYLMDCVYQYPISGSVTNGVWYWSAVVYAGYIGVAFPTTPLYVASPATYPDYRGISYVNLNNSVYITDGGFPMKYDGKSLARAGMPRFTTDLIQGGSTWFTTSYAGLLTAGTNYKYYLQHGYVDANGAEYLGKIVNGESKLIVLSTTSIGIPIKNIGNSFIDENTGFPVFACLVVGDQTLSGSGSKTLTVSSNHNVQAGMCLRIPVMNTSNANVTTYGWSFAYYKVTSVTPTSITFNKTVANHYNNAYSASIDGNEYGVILINNNDTVNLFRSNKIINACYVPTLVEGTVTEPNSTNQGQISQNWSPTPLYGAFCRIWRSTSNTDNFYKVADVPLSNRNDYLVLDTLRDTTLETSTTQMTQQTSISIDYSAGEEIPRACKFLSQWQGQLVQAGRPVIPSRIVGVNYPYYLGVPPSVGPKWGTAVSEAPWMYSEANLCDFQSFYWALSTAPEGFSQSGLNEDSVDTVFNDSVSGISANKDAFFVFKDRSTGFFTGSLAENQINKEIIEADIGCSSHRSIQEVRGGLLWLDGKNGFYWCAAGRVPVPVGYNVSDVQKLNVDHLDFSKAVACNFRLENLYVCAIEGKTYVYDYGETQTGAPRNAWYLWDRLNTTSILATANDELVLSSGTRLWKMKRTNSKYDFTDHDQAYTFELRTAWMNQGQPGIDKTFIAAWINAVQGDFSLLVSEYANYMDTLNSDYLIDFAPESATKQAVKVMARFNTAKVSSLSMGLSNSDKNKFVRIQGWDIQFAADFDKGEPKR